jgi:hypothetical protein
VHIFLYSIVPFMLLLIFNILLIYEASRSKIRLNRHRKLTLSATVIAMTIAFVLFTLPTAIVSAYFNIFEFSFSSFEHIKISICNAITYSYHAFNFFILYNTNKRFSRELKALFNAIKIKRTKAAQPQPMKKAKKKIQKYV